jgi:sugar phosphate isomerase/epimerase
MKFGLQLASLKKYLITSDDVLDTFMKVKNIGFNYVQVEYINEDVSVNCIKDCLDKSELECISTQVVFYFSGHKNIYDNLTQIIDRNILWQAKYVNAALNIPDDLNEISIIAGKVNYVSNKLNEKGLKLGVHPLFPGYVTNENTTPLEILWERLDDEILLLPDFYHVVRGKADPVQLINNFSGKIVEAHFKDFSIPNKNLDTTQLNNFDFLKQGVFPLTPIGQGVIPYKIIIDACLHNNVKYCWVEQESWDKDPFECIKESFDYLMEMGLNNK